MQYVRAPKAMRSVLMPDSRNQACHHFLIFEFNNDNDNDNDNDNHINNNNSNNNNIIIIMKG